jgi:hypothetical protein
MRALLLCLLVSCGPYRLPASDPCSLENPEFIALVTECDAKIRECPTIDGKPIESCPALRECENRKAKACGS